MRFRTPAAWTIPLLIALMACSAQPAGPGATSQDKSAAQDGPPKTLVIAQLNNVKGYGPWGFASTSGGGASLAEIHTVSLTSEDNNGNIEARAASVKSSDRS